MVRKLEMTWQASTRRWFKKYRGKMYTVSCRILGITTETKEASASAANAWWAAKLTEIESAPPSDEERKATATDVWKVVKNWSQLSEDDRERLIDALLGEGQYKQLKGQAVAKIAEVTDVPPPDRRVDAQVERWKATLLAACESGSISHGRLDAYRRRIQPFVDWIGPLSAVDTINEMKVEEYFNHLSTLVANGKYSPSSAHELLMTARQFIDRLALVKLIPLPGNLRDRRFRFNHSVATKIETFTVAELRAMLAACDGFSDRTKLYILLCLNCGMYQNDIAELQAEEVNWKEGTITRARSKTRERHGPVVAYKLWPETFALLKANRAQGDLALTTEEGKPLVKEWIDGGKYKKYDAIRSAWNRLAEKMDLKKHRLGLKHLRKTSATILGQHPTFKFYGNHFLADSPKGMAAKHYMVPSDAEFFDALDWLRSQILPERK